MENQLKCELEQGSPKLPEPQCRWLGVECVGTGEVNVPEGDFWTLIDDADSQGHTSDVSQYRTSYSIPNSIDLQRDDDVSTPIDTHTTDTYFINDANWGDTALPDVDDEEPLKYEELLEQNSPETLRVFLYAIIFILAVYHLFQMMDQYQSHCLML
mmetsp:Transcript_33185/g.88111  ORF Transcript_33185/g.88111 Transcript_33185/m.88111 type:complete len:156 (-) Transcript_33185:25-492(-)